MTTNEELIGRADVNDLEAILSITNKDIDEVIHAVKDNAEAIFTWDYEKGERPALNKLYEKAKTSQWNGETDLPWETEVDQEKVVLANAANNPGLDEGWTLPARRSRSGPTRSGSSWASSPRTGRSASSCTVSRARSCAPPRSSRPCRGSTRSTTRRPR